MTDNRCVNCGSYFEKEPDEEIWVPNICGPCGRHYLGLLEKAMGEAGDMERKIVRSKSRGTPPRVP